MPIRPGGFSSGSLGALPPGFNLSFILTTSTVMVLPSSRFFDITFDGARSPTAFPLDTGGFFFRANSTEISLVARTKVPLFEFITHTFANYCSEAYVSTRSSERLRLLPLRGPLPGERLCFLHGGKGAAVINLTIFGVGNNVTISSPGLTNDVGRSYVKSEVLSGQQLPMLFAVSPGVGERNELQISVEKSDSTDKGDSVRLAMTRDVFASDQGIVTLKQVRRYQPPVEGALFNVGFLNLEAAGDVVNVEKQGEPGRVEDDVGDQLPQKEIRWDYIAVLAIVAALLVLTVLACLYAVYVVNSRKQPPEKRRMPHLQMPPMGASLFHSGAHFPLVPGDL
jgi:hypothetical protein